MKKTTCTILFISLVFAMAAQTGPHKIVFDLSSEDTAIQSTVIRQFNNILKAAPDTELELVCHGKAIFMFVYGQYYFSDRVKDLQSKGAVSFKICANSMRRYQVDKSQIMAPGEIIPVAMLELSSKQREGWSYIKTGN